MYLHANYIPEPMGPGYIGEDGTLRAGVPLFGWREFVRRSAVMQHELGKRYTSLYLHMTSVNALAWTGWGTINLDWEWHMSLPSDKGTDEQTRFGLGCDDSGRQCNDTGIILAQTTGLQAGSIGVGISSGLQTCTDPSCAAPCRSRPDLNETQCMAWLWKTHVSTCLPHEVRPAWIKGLHGADGSAPSTPTVIPASPDGEYMEAHDVTEVVDIMLAAGYADSRCDVYRFWEPGFPIVVHRPAQEHATKALVVSCPALPDRPRPSVLVFLASFGPRTIVELELNATSLALPANATATDAETGELVPSRSGPLGPRLSARLDKHSYRMITVVAPTAVLKHDDHATRVNRPPGGDPSRRTFFPYP